MKSFKNGSVYNIINLIYNLTKKIGDIDAVWIWNRYKSFIW